MTNLPELPAGELLFYSDDDGDIQLHVYLENESVWLTQGQMAELFQRDKSVISRHIRNIFTEGELDEQSVVANFATTAADGKSYTVTYYNLDVIISVGYRVKSLAGTKFRQWATGRIREYIVKGFTMDDKRLADGPDKYWRELLERIRDIRSSERRLYQQVLDLYATSVDYDPNTPESREFFATIQNKLHYAAHGHTAAEIIYSRADASQPYMGLTIVAHDNPRSSDVVVAKNYLSEEEISRLNLIVSAYFDAAELRAKLHQVTRMADWLTHLTNMLQAMEAPILSNAGKISKKQADNHALAELKKYKSRTASQVTDVDRDYLSYIKDAQKRVTKNEHQ
ncbi:virulence RhuM family protein [Arcanobacterium buesumense]|uniref:Virulence RhuM family protein n=1 Tax=Arcanobacterium buesumense TaxID=2722751 RepID=A0A6H2EMT2_9ACTO|nr:virulence RhuM family protein [Arcanobacterium buesumense]QJC22383.1 virulence RhuM family protein [Arcanobacterium buesumense]